MNKEELLSCIEDEDNTDKKSKKSNKNNKYDYESPENFDMIPRFLLLDLISQKGTAREKLIVYLCKHRDSNNKIDKTQQKISQESEISLRTVKKEINNLVTEGFIKKKYGVVMINPEFIARGSKEKRGYLKNIYAAFGNKHTLNCSSHEK